MDDDNVIVHENEEVTGGYLSVNVGAVRTVLVELGIGSMVVRLLGPGDPHPTVADLDAISVAMTAANDGVRPAVRVLGRVGDRRGPDDRADRLRRLAVGGR